MAAADNSGQCTIAASPDQVAPLADRLRADIPAVFGDDDRYMIELGVVEALNNIILHGYPSRRGDARITVSWAFDGGSFRISVTDNGLPIPEGRLEAARGQVFEFDPEVLEKVPEGGLGLSIVNAVFDDVTYRRLGDRNELELSKRV